MSVRVISTEVNDRQGTIIIQADTQEEAMSTEARTAALHAAAANGLSRPGLSGGESAYPVDADGVSDEAVIMGRSTVAGYRCDYRITAGL